MVGLLIEDFFGPASHLPQLPNLFYYHYNFLSLMYIIVYTWKFNKKKSLKLFLIKDSKQIFW